MQYAVGSSTLVLPVSFRLSQNSPPGLTGVKFFGSYALTFGVSVSPGPTTCAKPGPAHTPVKFGLPSGARGTLEAAGVCARAGPNGAAPMKTAAMARTEMVRFHMGESLWPLLGHAVLGGGGEHLASISKRDA